MRRALPILALLALGACASVDTAPDAATPAPGASSGAPQPIAGYDWFFHDDDSLTLVYGLANSDDVRLSLGCQPGEGRLEMIRDAPADAPAEIYLESGGETERYPAKSEPSMMTDGQLLSGEADAGDPVFQRFRTVGWLALWHEGERDVLVPHPESVDGVERFFSRCG